MTYKKRPSQQAEEKQRELYIANLQKQAESDKKAANLLMTTDGYSSQTVLNCQQSCEKNLKALWLKSGSHKQKIKSKLYRSHDLRKLAKAVTPPKDKKSLFEKNILKVTEDMENLGKQKSDSRTLCVRARYPRTNFDFSDEVPCEMFTKEDAKKALKHTNFIADFCVNKQ